MHPDVTALALESIREIVLQTFATFGAPVLFLVFHVAEALRPRTQRPFSLFWRAQGFVVIALAGFIFGSVPKLLANIGAKHLLSLDVLPLPAAVVLGLLATNVVLYWLHRARHQVPVLWRLHQMHHSAERLDVSGAFLFHPLELVLVSVVTTTLGTFVLGLSPDAIAVIGMFSFFMSCFTHANIATPTWLTYAISRPELHAVHHERGRHASNYADLPIVDLVFGTFRMDSVKEAGYWDGASRKILPMLAGRDVTQEPRMLESLPRRRA